MAQSVPLAQEFPSRLSESAPRNEAYASGVSWAAVTAGAFVVAALSLILIALGVGVGLSSISPWSNQGASASAVRAGSIVWLIVVEILACSMGGYIAGRLRTKWVNVHTDEVYFRDTAHGLLVWAVGLVITAMFVGSAGSSLIGGAAGGAAMAGAGYEARGNDANAYFVDTLFRSGNPAADSNAGSNNAGATSAAAANSNNQDTADATMNASTQMEAERILANGIRQGGLPSADRSYLANLVAAKTGMQPSDADQRVSMIFDEERQAADTARKAAAHSMYWLFLAFLVGAFSASLAATMGGKQRDRCKAVAA